MKKANPNPLTNLPNVLRYLGASLRKKFIKEEKVPAILKPEQPSGSFISIAHAPDFKAPVPAMKLIDRNSEWRPCSQSDSDDSIYIVEAVDYGSMMVTYAKKGVAGISHHNHIKLFLSLYRPVQAGEIANQV